MIQLEHFTESETKRLHTAAEQAKTALFGNILKVEQYSVPLLMAGDKYPGMWLEHNQDNLFLAEYAPENAWASQTAFMDFQREDGLLPFVIPSEKGPFFTDDAHFWQVQSIYPFARCALEIAKTTGQGEAELNRIYRAAARFDDWLCRYRNRDGTGLVEMYCEYDTGHDHDPRVTDGGIPGSCPGNDAVNMPDLPFMPVLSVDLSAMAYGARIALAELAELLGKTDESDLWRERATKLKEIIKKLLYDPVDDFYYDRDRNGLRKYRTEHITRMFLNEVMDQEEFDRIYHRYFENPAEFLTPYPFPSVSPADPRFDWNCPRNSWGCNTQSLTSLRALLWLRHYGREEERTALLFRYFRSYLTHGTQFQQELNPFDGSPVGSGRNYTPTLILYLEGAKLLKGTYSPSSP